MRGRCGGLGRSPSRLARSTRRRVATGGGSRQDGQWSSRQRCEAGCGPWRARRCVVPSGLRRRDVLAAGGRRSAWWSLLIRQVRLWIRGRGGGGLGSGCGLDWYGTGRGSCRGKGGDLELVADSSLVLVGGGGSVGGGVGGASLRVLVMGVLCLRWLGSGVEGAVALWWATLGSGTKRLFRVLASVRCVGPVRSAGDSGAVRARSRSRRRSMVISSLGPSGRPWEVTARSANDRSHMAAGLGKSAILDAAMALSA